MKETQATIDNIFCDFAPSSELTISGISELIKHEEFDFQHIYDTGTCLRHQDKAFLSLAKRPELHDTLFGITKLLHSPFIGEDVFLEEKIPYQGTILLEGLRTFYKPVSRDYPELETAMIESAMGQLEKTESIEWLKSYIDRANKDEVVRIFKLAPSNSFFPRTLASFLRRLMPQILDLYLLPNLPENELLVRILIITFASSISGRLDVTYGKITSLFDTMTWSDSARKVYEFAKDRLSFRRAGEKDYIETFDYLMPIAKKLDTISAWSVIGELLVSLDKIYDPDPDPEVTKRFISYLEEITPSKVSPMEFKNGIAKFAIVRPNLSTKFPINYFHSTKLPLEVKRKIWARATNFFVLDDPAQVYDLESLLDMAFDEEMFPTNAWIDDQWIGDYLISKVSDSLAYFAVLYTEQDGEIRDLEEFFYNCKVVFLSWAYLLFKKEKMDFSILFDGLEENDWEKLYDLLAAKAGFGDSDDRVPSSIKELLCKVMSPEYFDLASLRMLVDSSYEHISQG